MRVRVAENLLLLLLKLYSLRFLNISIIKPILWTPNPSNNYNESDKNLFSIIIQGKYELTY